jgi:Arc/MetJ-type ribon-helix-helix transcriptional regulator
MGRQVRRLNFVIDDDVCKDLEKLVPSGKRSQVVNAALRKELEMIRRERAVLELLEKSRLGRKFTDHELVEGLAEDRGGH